MKVLLTGAMVYTANGFAQNDILVDHGRIVSISPMGAVKSDDDMVFDFQNCYVFPGFVDVQVPLREPGFSYKETIQSGTQAAARGGFTTVCTMPNLKPAPDSKEHLEEQLRLIREQALVRVHPYGTITVGEKGEQLSDMEGMAPHVVAFSDDGRGVQGDGIMKAGMQTAKRLGKIIAAHCEDETLLHGGYIHDGNYAKTHGHKGICSQSEWGQLERDLALVKETGCQYHVCHVSCKESVDLIRKAKQEGLDVTCETAPHYLVLTEEDLEEDGRFKMNPPLRGPEDRAALIEGIKDGTIDMIATDHAPHSAEEKAKGLPGSMMGVVGLETAFPVLYTKLVKGGVLSLEELIALLSCNPGRRFGIGTALEVGQPADLCVFDLNQQDPIDPALFQSLGRATPFAGMEVFGRCKLTMVNGRIVWEEA